MRKGLASELRASPTAGLAWAAVEEFVQQGTRLEGASLVAWAMADALKCDPRRVVFLGRPIVHLWLGDPWSKFPTLLSDEHLQWAVSDEVAASCDAAGVAAAEVCESVLEDLDPCVRQFARLVAFWARPAQVCEALVRDETTRIDRLELSICRLFASRDDVPGWSPLQHDPLLAALCSREELDDASLLAATSEATKGALDKQLQWFDGDLAGPLLVAAKMLRGDLPRMMKYLLDGAAEDPWRLQRILALALRLARGMHWSDGDRNFLGNLELNSAGPGWQLAELDMLRKLARERDPTR